MIKLVNLFSILHEKKSYAAIYNMELLIWFKPVVAVLYV